ncbi:MAG: hypothetical protein J6T31_05920 [Methanobrevibacter sp.]|nr:hypothetical protein [Methanobrevibacter sp.]
MIKLKEVLINTALLCLVLCILMCFLVLCNKYNETHYYAARAYNEMKASEYKMRAAQYQMETAKLRLDVEEARLQAFLNAYGGGRK